MKPVNVRSANFLMSLMKSKSGVPAAFTTFVINVLEKLIIASAKMMKKYMEVTSVLVLDVDVFMLRIWDVIMSSV